MKLINLRGIFATMLILAFCIGSYASTVPHKKAPPGNGTSFDILSNVESFGFNATNDTFEPVGGPLPPVLRWNYKHSGSYSYEKLSACLIAPTFWEDRQPGYFENWKVIRFRNYFKTIEPAVANRTYDKPIRLARSGYIRHMSNC